MLIKRDRMATECTQESVLDFLLENGGRVKNKDLVAHFKVFLSSENTKRAALKERFKRFVDNIAYVKQENGEKVVCLKKKYRFPEMRGEHAHEEEREEEHGRAHEEVMEEEHGRAHEEEKKEEHAHEEEREEEHGHAHEEERHEKHGYAHEEVRDEELRQRVRALGLEEHGNAQEEISLPEEGERAERAVGLESVRDERPEQVRVLERRSSGAAPLLSSRRRTSRGSQRSLLSAGEDGAPDGLMEDANTPRGSRKTFIELMMSSSPQVRRSLLPSSGRSVSLDEECVCVCVTLDPLEHEWMLSAADGDWLVLQRLLDLDPTLICKRDFLTGFTCLHWAAKQGKHELLAQLVDFGRRRGIPVDVNVRSSAGYTPLHLASMHNHVEVMKLLVGAFDADVDLRDHSGRKAGQYLRSGINGDIKDIIGACLDWENASGAGRCKTGEETRAQPLWLRDITGASGSSEMENAPGSGRWKLPRVLQSNLSALRLLNQPEEPRPLLRKTSIGRLRLQRSRFKTQIVHSTSFRESQETDAPLQSPGRSRPVSNLFG